MRVLEAYEQQAALSSTDCRPAAGEDTWTFSLPGGYTFQSQLQPNESTTLTVLDSSGNAVYSWNSGIFVSCFLLGAGVGAIVTSYAQNPRVGVLAATLTGAGCKAVVGRTNEDGDQYPDIPLC